MIGDKRIIEEGRMLNDKHINLAQRMIKQKFPSINGLHLTLLQDKPHTERTEIHINENHWVCAASMKGKQVQVFVQTGMTRNHYIAKADKSSIKFLQVQKQIGGCDCGLFAIANAFTVAFNCNPTDTKYRYDQSQMCQHLLHCISNNVVEPFP